MHTTLCSRNSAKVGTALLFLHIGRDPNATEAAVSNARLQLKIGRRIVELLGLKL
jgi:hypothetical protein